LAAKAGLVLRADAALKRRSSTVVHALDVAHDCSPSACSDFSRWRVGMTMVKSRLLPRSRSGSVPCFICMKGLTGKLILGLAGFVWLVGCASIGPPVPPELELPRAPADLKAIQKGDKVTLTWTIPTRTTTRQSVRYLGKTRVCRSVNSALKQCGVVVGEVAPPEDFRSKQAGGKKLTASYVDTLPVELQRKNTLGSAGYAVEVLNRDGRASGLSNEVRVPLAETLPPPANFAARVTAQGVELTWSGLLLQSPAGSIRYGYWVYRREEGSRDKALVGERSAGAEKDLSLTDTNFDWEQTYYYHAESFTAVAQAGKADVVIDGDDTAEVKVFTHDVFPPAVPSGLQAVFSGPGQEPFIDLIWTPVGDADWDGYNVYRREASGAAVKLNSELVKTPAYRDVKVEAGKTYFYSVSAVDLRGNESARSEESSERVP
jgi:hypothetical protein